MVAGEMGHDAEMRPRTADAPRETEKERITRAFLRMPNPQKELLVKGKSTELFHQLVMKERRVKQLEDQVRVLRGVNGQSSLGNEERSETLTRSMSSPAYEALERDEVEDLMCRVKGVLKNVAETSSSKELDLAAFQSQLKTIVKDTSKAIQKLRREKDVVAIERTKLHKTLQKNKSAVQHSIVSGKEIRVLKNDLSSSLSEVQAKEIEINSQHRKLETLSLQNSKLKTALMNLSTSIRGEEKLHHSKVIKRKEVAFQQGYFALLDDNMILTRQLEEANIRISELKVSLRETVENLRRIDRKTRMRNGRPSQVFKAMKELEKKLRKSNPDDKEHDDKSSDEGNEEENENDRKKEVVKLRRSTMLGAKLLKSESSTNIPSMGPLHGFSSTITTQATIPEMIDLRDAQNLDKILKASRNEEENFFIGFDGEDRLKRYLCQMRSVFDVLKRLHLQDPDLVTEDTRPKTADDVVRIVSQQGMKCFGATALRLYIYDESSNTLWTKGNVLKQRIHLGAHSQLEIRKADQEPIEESDMVAHCYITKENLHVEPTVLNINAIKKNALVIPVFGSGDKRAVVGVLCASEKMIKQRKIKQLTSSVFTEYDESLLCLLADHIAGTLDTISQTRANTAKSRIEFAIQQIPAQIHTDFTQENADMRLGLRIENFCRSLVRGRQAKVFILDVEMQSSLKMWSPSRDRDGEPARKYFDVSPSSSISSSCLLSKKEMKVPDVYVEGSFNANIDLRSDAYHGGPLVCIPLLLPPEGESYIGSVLKSKRCGNNFSSINRFGDPIVLGCVEVSFNIESTASSTVCLLEDAADALGKYLNVVSSQIDMMWQFRFSNRFNKNHNNSY